MDAEHMVKMQEMRTKMQEMMGMMDEMMGNESGESDLSEKIGNAPMGKGMKGRM